MVPGDLVRVKVVGLAALRRTWHDSLAVVLAIRKGPRAATLDGPEKENYVTQVLHDGRIKWVSMALLQVVEPTSVREMEEVDD